MAGSNLFRRGVGVLARHAKASNAKDVRYLVKWENQTFGPFEAVPGRQFQDATDLDGVNAVGHQFDWLVESKDLVLLGKRIEPAEGDQIACIWEEIGLRVTYDVRPMSGEVSYSLMDSEGVMFRIHTVVRKREPYN